MIRSKFDDLRRAKAFQEKRDLPLRLVAEETGLSEGTILRIRSNRLERVYISTLDRLCRYFGVDSISELIEFEKDQTVTNTADDLEWDRKLVGSGDILKQLAEEAREERRQGKTVPLETILDSSPQ